MSHANPGLWPREGPNTQTLRQGEGFDPKDITNPASAFFFLSDDAQDAIQGSDKRKMRCLTCGDNFTGDVYDGCPECFSPNTEKLSE